MIVREVLQAPQILDRFDWFNDGQDTINWLKGASLASLGAPHVGQPETLALIARMEQGLDAFCDAWRSKLYQKG